MPSKIPHFGLVRQYQNLKKELLDVTDTVLKTGCLMDGEYTNKFESWLKNKTGANYAVTVHSCTQALEMIALYMTTNFSFEKEKATKVYIPNITYVATLNAFLNAGYEVELLDTDKNGLVMESTIEELPKSSIVCSVGLYGANPVSFNNKNIILKVIDGAQHWLIVNSGKVGLGMAISFDPTKNLNSCGNGGAIVTNSIDLYHFALSYRNNGKNYFESLRKNVKTGTNSRMSEIDTAHCLVKTSYIDDWQLRRKKIRYYYLDQFKNLPLRCLSNDSIVHADQKFVIYTENRDVLFDYLKTNNIECKIHYPRALSELEIAKNIKNKPSWFSTSVLLTKGVLSLPIYPELTDAEIEYISSTVRKFFDK